MWKSLGGWMRAWCDRFAGPGPWSAGDLADQAVPDVPFGLVRDALRPQLTTYARAWLKGRGVTVPAHETGTTKQAETYAYEQLTLDIAVEHLRFLDEKVDLSRRALRAEAEDCAQRLGIDVDVLLTAAKLRNVS
jgi:hypothetical protein